MAVPGRFLGSRGSDASIGSRVVGKVVLFLVKSRTWRAIVGEGQNVERRAGCHTRRADSEGIPPSFTNNHSKSYDGVVCETACTPYMYLQEANMRPKEVDQPMQGCTRTSQNNGSFSSLGLRLFALNRRSPKGSFFPPARGKNAGFGGSEVVKAAIRDLKMTMAVVFCSACVGWSTCFGGVSSCWYI